MRIDAQILKSAALAALLSATALNAANAWEAKEVAARYKTLSSDFGLKFSWSAARRDGASIVLKDVSLTVPADGFAKEFDELVLEDVSETNSTYEIGRISVDAIEHSSDQLVVTLAGYSIEGIVLPKAIEKPLYGGVMQYRHVALEEAHVRKPGETPFLTFKDTRFDTQLGENMETLAFEGAMETVLLDLSKITGNDGSRTPFGKGDYGEFSGRIDLTGSWNTENGRFLISRFDTELEGVGTLSFALDIGGYTADLYRAIQELQEQIANSTGEQQQLQGLAMVGLMQQLNLNGASIRFSDASLTGKLIAYVAAQQGIKPEDVVNQARAIVPLMAGQYLGPDLTQSFAKAVTTYLDDPHNLTISVAPEEPMPVAVLMGAAMGSPEALARQLGLQVLANQ